MSGPYTYTSVVDLGMAVCGFDRAQTPPPPPRPPPPPAPAPRPASPPPLPPYQPAAELLERILGPRTTEHARLQALRQVGAACAKEEEMKMQCGGRGVLLCGAVSVGRGLIACSI